VTASVDEAATTFEYGKITTLATGTQNQETIGPADFGEIVGNEIIIRLSLAKVNAAVGANVLNTTSTNTQAEAQILIGSSLSGGLLLNSDQGTGANFFVGSPVEPDPTPTPTPEPTATPTPEPTATPTPQPTATPAPTPGGGSGGNGNAGFKEVYSGTIRPGQASVEVPFEVRLSRLESVIKQNHGNQQIIFEILDPNGTLLATAADDEISLHGLTPGRYIFRIRGSVTKPVDFTIRCTQTN
jgi:hypothetical protein